MSSLASSQDRPDTDLEERLVMMAHEIVPDDTSLATLATTLAAQPTITGIYIDYVIQNLGIPEPDYLEDGKTPLQSSVTRKLLLWARRLEITDALRVAHRMQEES